MFAFINDERFLPFPARRVLFVILVAGIGRVNKDLLFRLFSAVKGHSKYQGINNGVSP